jgi:hypothetical protein
MLETNVERLLAAYPAIYLACHRDHIRTDEAGNPLTEKQGGAAGAGGLYCAQA